MTEARVRNIVRDELENWHAPTMIDDVEPELPDVSNWRAQAKELGVDMYHKKKDDVLKEIEARLSGATNVPEDRDDI
jgi:hypothetical protein